MKENNNASGVPKTHAANSRPEIEQAIQAIGDICHEQYLGSWKRPDTYDEYEYAYKTEVIYLLDDPRVKEVLQSLIAQEADKLANKQMLQARIDENNYWLRNRAGLEKQGYDGSELLIDSLQLKGRIAELKLDKGDSQ